jgi:hypothetical protein
MLFFVVKIKEAITKGTLALVVFCAVFIAASSAHAATLNIAPVSGASSYSIGQLFSVGVYVSTPASQPMNAVSGILQFDPNLVQLVSVEKGGSIIDFWIGDSSFSNAEGKVNFEGGRYNPGYSGTNGKVISFLFKAKAKGTATFSLGSASVLANDGVGTAILERTGTASVTISQAVKEPVSAVPSIPIRSTTHPDQNTWYTTKTVSVNWDVPSSATGVRTSLTKNATDLPTVIATPPISNTTLEVEDGVWYFHLQGRDASGWGPATHYKVMIDTQPRVPPKFDEFARTILQGEPVRISGTTYPDSTVLIYVTDSSGNEGSQETRSDEDGEFDVVWKKKLGKGAYNVSAMVTDARKLSSPRSADVPITIQAEALERVGWPLLNMATLFFIVTLVVALGIAWMWFLVSRLRAYRRKVRWDVKETDTRIREKFKRLQAHITDHIKLLKREGEQRELSPQEEKLIYNIEKVLEDADMDIEKDVDRIGK